MNLIKEKANHESHSDWYVEADLGPEMGSWQAYSLANLSFDEAMKALHLGISLLRKANIQTHTGFLPRVRINRFGTYLAALEWPDEIAIRDNNKICASYGAALVHIEEGNIAYNYGTESIIELDDNLNPVNCDWRRDESCRMVFV